MQAGDLLEDQPFNLPAGLVQASEIRPHPNPLPRGEGGALVAARAVGALLQELHDGLGGDAVGLETARQKAANLATPAQTPDLVIREQQGFPEYDLPTFRGQRRRLY